MDTSNLLPQTLTPTAYQIGQYGRTPVSYFHGLPQISVPLTEVRGRGITIPVSLSYHGGGIKAEQHLGWVGLGWSLQAGGCITRVVNGIKDEMSASEYGHLHNTYPSTDPGCLHHSSDIQDGPEWTRADLTNGVSYDACGRYTGSSGSVVSTSYNEIGLPLEMTLSDGSMVRTVYAADGRKLRETTVLSGTSATRSYSGSCIFEGNTLKKVLFEGGYAQMNGSTPSYMFFLTDHLGSVRVVAAQNADVKQVNQYYPFGDLIADSHVTAGTSDNRYRFIGKEFGERTGLYDFSARYLEPSMGRFTTIDPLAEKYPSVSPYAYCAGDPVNFVDPEGKWIIVHDGSETYKYNDGQMYIYNKNGDFEDTTLNENSFAYGILTALNQLTKTKTGKAIVDFFANNENEVRIHPSEYENGIYGESKIVLKNSFEGSEIPTEKGIEKSPFWLDLGHELAHRMDFINSSYDFANATWLTLPDVNNTKVSESEKFATHYENLIRQESGLPLRTHYAIYNDNPYEPTRLIDRNGVGIFNGIRYIPFKKRNK